jgi:glycosyltransferase involved in cell wall biosynthesis
MWIVCQIGAREHYAIPRALLRRNLLGTLITDFWIAPGSAVGKLPGARRLQDRYHAELSGSKIHAPNLQMLGFEIKRRLTKPTNWAVNLERNAIFQRLALRYLKGGELQMASQPSPTLFSYSYAAGDLFKFAKQRGWRTVLGQIDPGPEEERIVAQERQRYSGFGSRWQPAPRSYWDSWRVEVNLADSIIVNSEWSRECLLKEGVPPSRIEVIPLVYNETSKRKVDGLENKAAALDRPLRLLFLGQLNLRKGIARLLDAMRLLRGDAVELTMAGPSEVDPSAWSDLPNVKWLGPVPRSEVGTHYQNADVFILPTLSDGYALTQLEALSHGLPVIASRHCGAAVSHGINGWLLDDLEPEAIARAIRGVRDSQMLSDVRAPRFGMEDLADALIDGKSPMLPNM